MHKHAQAGFTIMELMIVVTIVGILGAVALPGLQIWVKNAGRTVAVTEFLGSMHFARSESVKRNVRVAMCPSSTGTSCDNTTDWAVGWIVFVDTNNDLKPNTGEEVLLKHEQLKSPWTLISNTDDTALAFRPNGRMVDSSNGVNLDFNLCDDRGPDEGRVISVGNSGRPQTALLALDNSKPDC